MTKKFDSAAKSTEYPFEANNPYLFHDAPFDEGLELLAAGTLSEAVLAFEAVCQKEPERVEGWQFLGTTQAENEKDGLAILALNKARQLCPSNRHVLQALAVSHTNEANQGQALEALKAWALANESYAPLHETVKRQLSEGPAAAGAGTDGPWTEDFLQGGLDDDFARQFMFMSKTEHREVETLLLAAAELAPGDADVHVALGIAHNLSHDYEAAAADFRAALKLRPEDEKLWNKLGATLANGSKSREAIAAYEKALDINPGFVRAQYNLGIAHSNLSEHRAAARQFIRAITMQQGGAAVPAESGSGPPRSTREMWDVLRMTFNLMERPDLVDKAWAHDVNPFLDEFGLGELRM